MSALTGTGALVRLILRRERIIAPVWMFLLVLIGIGNAPYYAQRFSDPSTARGVVEEVVQNRVLLAFSGQIPAESLPGLVTWKSRVFVYLLVALAVAYTVVRHSRGDEESGRQELLRAGVVGRHAPLTAALLVGCGFCVPVGLLISAGWIGYGFAAAGSLAFGLGCVVFGWFFAAIAAVAAQLTRSARTAGMAAFVAITISYVVRFAADGTGQDWLRWLSPEGWSHAIRPFGGERWWVLGLLAGAGAVVAGCAYQLASRRDFGSGLLPDRPGPATGPGLTSPFRLAWRLQRGMLMGWTVGVALAAVLLGGVAVQIPELADRAGPATAEFFRRYAGSSSASLVDAYLWLILVNFGYFVVLYPALAALKLRSEEAGGYAELLLATSVGRLRWAFSHLVFATLGPVVVLATGGVVMGLIYGAAIGDIPTQLPRLVIGALIPVPAVWTLGGLAVLAIGLLPRLAVAISWAGFVFVNIFGEVLGPVLGLSYAIADQAVPFHYLPRITAGGVFTPVPLEVLTGVAVLLAAVGLGGLRRRDITV